MTRRRRCDACVQEERRRDHASHTVPTQESTPVQPAAHTTQPPGDAALRCCGCGPRTASDFSLSQLLLGEARRCAVCESYCGSKPRRCPQQEGQRMCQACGKWYLQTKSSHAEVLAHACCPNCASRGFHYKCGHCSLLKQREAFQLTPNLQRCIQRRKCDACRAEYDKAFLPRCTHCGEEKSKAVFSRLSAITLRHKDKRVCDECHAKEPLFRCTQCEEEKSSVERNRAKRPSPGSPPRHSVIQRGGSVTNARLKSQSSLFQSSDRHVQTSCQEDM